VISVSFSEARKGAGQCGTSEHFFLWWYFKLLYTTQSITRWYFV